MPKLELNIKKINDLYFERYIGTKKMIDHFHEMVASGELDSRVESPDNIGIEILSHFVSSS